MHNFENDIDVTKFAPNILVRPFLEQAILFELQNLLQETTSPSISKTFNLNAFLET